MKQQKTATSADSVTGDLILSASAPVNSIRLRPFIRYYGGKFRAAPRYPLPKHGRIVEPFAGAAGYAMRYPHLQVTLVERFAKLAEMWRYLIGVSAAEIRRIPCVEAVADLPAWVPEGARILVGFRMNDASETPRNVLSAGRKKLAAMGRKYEGWTHATKEMVACQVEHIRHWKLIEGDYTDAPDVDATWFVDPPYNNKAGSRYIHGPSAIDFTLLAAWCRGRRGLVIVCENEGAEWLPFRPFWDFKGGITGAGLTKNRLKEVIWTNDTVDRINSEITVQP